MWSPWRDESITCIACGASVRRDEAREYDKYGDRWDRVDKEFEHLCKPCDRELSRTRRGNLESLLVEAGAGECAKREFLARYLEAVGEPSGAPERRGGRD